MRLLGRDKLQVLCGLDDSTDRWVRSWASEIQHASWKKAEDLLYQFPSVMSYPNEIFLFPVAPRRYAIEISARFSSGIVLVTDLKNLADIH